jgi:hypothetical protein
LRGTLVAYRRRQRNPDYDTFPIVTRWSGVGLLFGVLYVFGRAVL